MWTYEVVDDAKSGVLRVVRSQTKHQVAQFSYETIDYLLQQSSQQRFVVASHLTFLVSLDIPMAPAEGTQLTAAIYDAL